MRGVVIGLSLVALLAGCGDNGVPFRAYLPSTEEQLAACTESPSMCDAEFWYDCLASRAWEIRCRGI